MSMVRTSYDEANAYGVRAVAVGVTFGLYLL
jgi:hypothetical protein